MSKFDKSVIGLALAGVLAGCLTSGERYANAVDASERMVKKSLTAKANAGKFYSKYNTPSDAEIVAAVGYTPEADEMADLRKATEDAVRRFEREVVWPAWVAAIKAKAEPAADAMLAKGDYANAREVIWRASTTTVPAVDEEVRKWGYEYLNTKVNPADWARIEQDVNARYAQMIAAGKYEEVLAWLAAYPRIRTFSTIIDGKLADVKAEIVSLGVPGEKIDPEVVANLVMVGTVDSIIDTRDTTTNLVSSVSTEPDLDEFNRKLEEYRKALVRFNSTDPNAKAVVADFRARVAEYLDALKTSSSSSQAFLYLGTTAVNVRTDVLTATLAEDCVKVWIEALRAEFAAIIEKEDVEGAAAFIAMLESKDREEFKPLIEECNEKLEALKKLLAERARAAYLAELAAACSAVKDQAVALVREGKFDEARAGIRDVELKMDPEWDAAVYVTRVDTLNSIINPRQCRALLEEIDAKVAELKEAEDYEGLLEYVKNYAYVRDTYREIEETIVKIKEAMIGLELKDGVAVDYADRLAAAIVNVLDNRCECGDLNEYDFSALDKALAEFQQAYLAQYYKPGDTAATAAIVGDDVRNMVKAQFAPITTAELNARLAARLQASLEGVVQLAAVRDARLAKERYTALVKEMDGGEGELSLDELIALIEDELPRQVGVICPCARLELNAVLGDCARVLRVMKQGGEIADGDANTLLAGAIFINNEQLFARAIELGAKVDVPAARDPRKRPALLLAIETGNTAFVTKIDEAGGANTVVDGMGNTALHYAAKRGELALVKVLAQTLDLNAVNERGETALFPASWRNNVAVIGELIAAAGDNAEAFVNIADAKGGTALSAAARAEALAAMDALAAAGAKASNADLVEAAGADRLAVAKWLVARGADVNGEGVMAAAFRCQGSCDSATFRYLVSQGGIPAK